MNIISTIATALLVFAMLIAGSTDAFAQERDVPDLEQDSPRIVVDDEAPGDELDSPRIVVDGDATADDGADSEAPDDDDADSEGPDEE
jgi:hypothetical protein